MNTDRGKIMSLSRFRWQSKKKPQQRPQENVVNALDTSSLNHSHDDDTSDRMEKAKFDGDNSIQIFEEESCDFQIRLREPDSNKLKKKGSLIRRQASLPAIRASDSNDSKPIISILKPTGFGEKRVDRSQSDKRLTFAMSPTFISEPRLTGHRSSITQDSLHSLDGDDLFADSQQEATKNQQTTSQENSLVMGDLSSQQEDGRRSSMLQNKAKSTLGFDERFIGMNESDLGSIGNASWSSVP